MDCYQYPLLMFFCLLIMHNIFDYPQAALLYENQKVGSALPELLDRTHKLSTGGRG